MTRRAVLARAEERVRDEVRTRYGRIADEAGSRSCCGEGSACCGGSTPTSPSPYAAEDLSILPRGADLGLGCGRPTTLLPLRPGETVLDLGSGAGVDCFLAANAVGPRGRVIGVDMTPEMVARARANGRAGAFRNVEFRLGEVEHLPLADRSVDVVISNCVVNLAPDKAAVYREAFRVLRPGGRLAISDVIATRPISARDRSNAALWSACSSGAITRPALRRVLRRAGFEGVHVEFDRSSAGSPTLEGQARLGVVPASIRAVKPAG